MNQNDIINEIEKIKTRNKKVEIDKKWETSLTRKIILACLTYLVLGLYMNAISITKPWLNSITPTLGFLFSTLSLHYFKKFWEKFISK